MAGLDTHLETDPDQNSHSVLRQIVNPGGKNRDDVAFGNTAHVTGDNVNTTSTGRSDLTGSSFTAAGAS